MWRESPLVLKKNKEVFVYKNKQAQFSQSSHNQGEKIAEVYYDLSTQIYRIL